MVSSGTLWVKHMLSHALPGSFGLPGNVHRTVRLNAGSVEPVVQLNQYARERTKQLMCYIETESTDSDVHASLSSLF